MHATDGLTRILIIVAPNFNLAATVGFLDPFRAANYLEGKARFTWELASLGTNTTIASNGLAIETKPLSLLTGEAYEMVLVSSSWTPELYENVALTRALRNWARAGVTLGAIDTGAFLLARAELLHGRRATVHYEHSDAFQELFPDIELSDQLFIFDDDRISCCGGEATYDFALHIVRMTIGETAANNAARYLLHERLRPLNSRQGASSVEPLGSTVPDPVRSAIQIMKDNLEFTVSIPEICDRLHISQRHLDRLFHRFVGKSPSLYYRDIRLDRARGLVTQTELPLSQVAIASGFANAAHFSRAYREQFGLPPKTDRVKGRIPFQFRAWPLHDPGSKRMDARETLATGKGE